LRAIATIVAALVLVPSAGAVVCHRPTDHDFYRLQHEYPRFRHALVRTFGPRWREAAIVSFGEGSWHSWAANGQYEGTFQMGSSERTLYGHGPTLEAQVRAAHRYWLRSGWSPWDCKP
jgi:hypothetical protein